MAVGLLLTTAPAAGLTLPAAADGHAGFSAYDGPGNGNSVQGIVTGRSYVDGSGTRVNRAINIRFDLTSIAPGTTIYGATLRLYQNLGPTGLAVRVLRLASGSTTYTDSTFDGSTNIEDIAATDSTVLATNSSRTVGAYNDWTSPELLAEVQSWIDTPGGNYGFRVQNISFSGETGVYFTSREGFPNGEVPQLLLDLQPSVNLTIRKFFDCDEDGAYNGDDKYLSGWQFNVSNTAYGGSYDEDHVTDAGGQIALAGLAHGQYDVTEIMKGTGWYVTVGANPRTVTVGAGNVEVQFANVLPGDANQDEKVNLADFTVLKAHFGESPAGWLEGNFNGDNVTNLADFTILKAHYGEGSPAASVPAPATLALLAAAAPLLLKRKRG